MIHLNKSPASRSAGNAWNWANGDVYPVLLEMMEARELLLCRAVSSKRTFAAPEVGVALVRSAGDRAKGLTDDLVRTYQLIRTEGPLTRQGLCEALDCSTSKSRQLLDRLIDKLLIVPLEDAHAARSNWPELAYWTMDEWLLDQDAGDLRLVPAEQAEETVASAAAKCLMTDCPDTIARALGWPEERARSCLCRIDPRDLRDANEPVRLDATS